MTHNHPSPIRADFDLVGFSLGVRSLNALLRKLNNSADKFSPGDDSTLAAAIEVGLGLATMAEIADAVGAPGTTGGPFNAPGAPGAPGDHTNRPWGDNDHRHHNESTFRHARGIDATRPLNADERAAFESSRPLTTEEAQRQSPTGPHGQPSTPYRSDSDPRSRDQQAPYPQGQRAPDGQRDSQAPYPQAPYPEGSNPTANPQGNHPQGTDQRGAASPQGNYPQGTNPQGHNPSGHEGTPFRTDNRTDANRPQTAQDGLHPNDPRYPAGQHGQPNAPYSSNQTEAQFRTANGIDATRALTADERAKYEAQRKNPAPAVA